MCSVEAPDTEMQRRSERPRTTAAEQLDARIIQIGREIKSRIPNKLPIEGREAFARNLHDLLRQAKQETGLGQEVIAQAAISRMSNKRLARLTVKRGAILNDRRRDELAVYSNQYLLIAEAAAREMGRPAEYGIRALAVGTPYDVVGSVDLSDAGTIESLATISRVIREGAAKIAAHTDIENALRAHLAFDLAGRHEALIVDPWGQRPKFFPQVRLGAVEVASARAELGDEQKQVWPVTVSLAKDILLELRLVERRITPVFVSRPVTYVSSVINPSDNFDFGSLNLRFVGSPERVSPYWVTSKDGSPVLHHFREAPEGGHLVGRLRTGEMLLFDQKDQQALAAVRSNFSEEEEWWEFDLSSIVTGVTPQDIVEILVQDRSRVKLTPLFESGFLGNVEIHEDSECGRIAASENVFRLEHSMINGRSHFSYLQNPIDLKEISEFAAYSDWKLNANLLSDDGSLIRVTPIELLFGAAVKWSRDVLAFVGKLQDRQRARVPDHAVIGRDNGSTET